MAGIPYSRATTAPCDHADEPRHDPAGSREQQPLERVHALDSGRIGPELNASDVLDLPDDPLARVPGAPFPPAIAPSRARSAASVMLSPIAAFIRPPILRRRQVGRHGASSPKRWAPSSRKEAAGAR
ncbi:MAG: hypothetical protein A3G84_07250 [Chloroflexi bacterium RIFCSPLOWO2_12_FULL_71_12]|nr:MAG: hypothetical protein A3G84_07250 [Chloroflexi bacterium RIFCSPLOWO2_12_FULL_71_12]